MEKKVNPIQQIEPKQEPAEGRQGYAEPIKQEPAEGRQGFAEPKQEEAKPKKKVLKKVTKYVEADEDDDDDDDEVIITKPKKKEKQIEAQNIKQPELSYSDLLYQTSLERLQTKMLSERAKSIVHSVIPHYY